MFSESLSAALVDRRHLLTAGAAGLASTSLMTSASAANRRTLDFKNPDDNVYAWLKIYGDIAGGVDVYSWFRWRHFCRHRQSRAASDSGL